MRLLLKLPGLLIAIASLCACTPPEELDGDELEPSMEWEDIVFHLDSRTKISVVSATAAASRMSTFKAAGSGASEMSRLLVSTEIENPSPYAGGMLGAKDGSKYFIASLAAIPQYDRLYWVMVKVLSEKYSCFIKSKQELGSMTRITCRDKRQVMFWKKVSGQHIEFLARQFDLEGYEIKVIKKKIVRISDVRVI